MSMGPTLNGKNDRLETRFWSDRGVFVRRGPTETTRVSLSEGDSIVVCVDRRFGSMEAMYSDQPAKVIPKGSYSLGRESGPQNGLNSGKDL